MQNILWFDEIGKHDIDKVGGKNSSLGEMYKHLRAADVKVPFGFATTAEAFFAFLDQNHLAKRIEDKISQCEIENVESLKKTGHEIRQMILDTEFLPDFIKDVTIAYEKLLKQEGADITVAVRSSATAEDLPDASFAGQQETFLNVYGIENIFLTLKHVFASIYTDRAIAYRHHHQFDHHKVALSAGIQRMVRSDLAASGVMFSIDTESGFDDVVLINGSYGLGEMVVQGAVNPDEFYVYKPSLKQNKSAILRKSLGAKNFKMIYGENQDERVKKVSVAEELSAKFCLNDDEIATLAKYAITIENHYGCPMDIEWAKDGNDGKLYILQARPETVKSRKNLHSIQRYILDEKSEVLAEGRSIGQKIGTGVAKVLMDASEINRVKKGDIIVTDMTDPDWEPVMKIASAIVTNRGGRTCHAAIIARELGIPAVVGCGDATDKIQEGSEITVSCSEGDTGVIYKGKLKYSIHEANLDKMPKLPFKIMLNVGNPDRAFAFHELPNAGVGLARLEFIISQMIGIHPKALLEFNSQSPEIKKLIQKKISAYPDPVEYYVERLKEGIATIAATFAPNIVIVRLSDFKTNEYGNLLGGEKYEFHEENPMLGFRGAARYIDESFRPCFELECRAVKRVREEMGLKNVAVMIPFVRTLTEAKEVIKLLEENGLRRGEDDLKIIMMCEIPANAVLAEEFLQYFDGFSIGSNDLTQLSLGVDRDSGVMAKTFDERDPAVKAFLKMAIEACKKHNKYIGICGQGPSDHPDLAQWLMEQGIESISLNPDTVIDTWLFLAKNLQH